MTKETVSVLLCEKLLEFLDVTTFVGAEVNPQCRSDRLPHVSQGLLLRSSAPTSGQKMCDLTHLGIEPGQRVICERIDRMNDPSDFLGVRRVVND